LIFLYNYITEINTPPAGFLIMLTDKISSQYHNYTIPLEVMLSFLPYNF